MEAKNQQKGTKDNANNQPVKKKGETARESGSAEVPKTGHLEVDAKITALVESFEKRIRTLRTTISELESQVSELRSAKDRVKAAFNEFLNVQELTDMIRTTQEPEEVTESLKKLVGKFIQYESMGIFLYDEERTGLRILGAVPSLLTKAVRNQQSEGIIDWVISERRPVVIPWTASFGEEVNSKRAHLIIVPLIVGDQSLGVVLFYTLFGPDKYSSQDLKMLFFAVSHAAVAIQNSERAQEVSGSRDFLSNLLENAGDIIFSLDSNGKFSYLNPRISELGFHKEELLGQHFKKLFRQAEIGNRFNSTLQSGSRQVFEMEVDSTSQPRRQYTVNLVPLKEEGGKIVGALGIMRNVTEINQLHRRLLESERLAAYTQTVITLNHEINNPLTTVLGNVFLMEKDASEIGSEKISKRLKVIQENCQRIQNVIKKLERIDELKTVSYVGSTKMVDLGKQDEDS